MTARFRETGFRRHRDSSPEIPPWVISVSAETKRQRRSPPIAGHLHVSGKSRGSKECVVGPGGMPRNSNSSGLDLQTTVSAHIERKCVFGAVTNLAVDPPPNLSAASVKITIIPAPSGIGRFEARLDGNDRLLCVSRTPFFDAARELIADGYDPDT